MLLGRRRALSVGWGARAFRCAAALDAVRAAVASAEASRGGGGGGAHLALYNYPSFSGAAAAAVAWRFHELQKVPLLALPFSSVEPFRAEDFKCGAFETCYLLDFIGPGKFAIELSKFIPRVVAFDHHQYTHTRIWRLGQLPDNLKLFIDPTKCTARAALEFFSEKLSETASLSDDHVALLDPEVELRLTSVLRYIEDMDLRLWKLPDIKEFQAGIRDELTKLNSVMNPNAFRQIFELNAAELIQRGKSCVASRKEAAKSLILNPFKIRIGGGLYGECLAIRADGNPSLSREIGLELSTRSAEAGLRRIGAVVFMQRRNLKMCLHTTDDTINIAKIAKACGGGGNRTSGSFIIRMDEYSHWRKTHS